MSKSVSKRAEKALRALRQAGLDSLNLAEAIRTIAFECEFYSVDNTDGSEDMVVGARDLYDIADCLEEPLTPLRNDDGTLKQVMPKVNGMSFRCMCGCNVFHHPDCQNEDLYACNACGQEYLGADK